MAHPSSKFLVFLLPPAFCCSLLPSSWWPPFFLFGQRLIFWHLAIVPTPLVSPFSPVFSFAVLWGWQEGHHTLILFELCGWVFLCLCSCLLSSCFCSELVVVSSTGSFLILLSLCCCKLFLCSGCMCNFHCCELLWLVTVLCVDFLGSCWFSLFLLVASGDVGVCCLSLKPLPVVFNSNVAAEPCQNFLFFFFLGWC